ncbi:MAG: hypothetical protein MHMPM18_000797 [Marteilia pararefringens]
MSAANIVYGSSILIMSIGPLLIMFYFWIGCDPFRLTSVMTAFTIFNILSPIWAAFFFVDDRVPLFVKPLATALNFALYIYAMHCIKKQLKTKIDERLAKLFPSQLTSGQLFGFATAVSLIILKIVPIAIIIIQNGPEFEKNQSRSIIMAFDSFFYVFSQTLLFGLIAHYFKRSKLLMASFFVLSVLFNTLLAYVSFAAFNSDFDPYATLAFNAAFSIALGLATHMILQYKGRSLNI